jgi:hypothetical protein
LLPIAVFLAVTPAFGQAPGPTVDQLVDQAGAALKANRVAEAARACAAALKSDPMDARAQTCASGLRDKVQPLATAATALLGAGDVDDAHTLCAALLILDPTNADAQKCATGAGARIAARAQERVKLEQAEGLIARGEVAQATKLLAEVATSYVPAHLDRTRDLQERLNDQAHAQLTAAKRAEIARARAMISEGRRSEAATTLATVIASSPGQDVTQEAHTMMSDTGTSWLTQFRDALKTPWLIQVLTGLVILAGLWVGLHLLRDGWRWWVKRLAKRAGRERVWKFGGMGADPVGARDAILDAIHRVPREVKEPIWTPTRLLLYPIASAGWEVWEDFAVYKKAKPIHEPSFDIKVDDGQANQVLVDAFQNLQFSVGSISVAGIARLWTALVEWWQTGDPAVAGEAREIKVGNETKQVTIRLTASGCNTGTVSVMATTDVAAGLDAVAVSAERAAYKLLSRIGKNKDSAKQIDGHAAFRQGVTSFASCMRIVIDADTAREHRDAALVKTIANLAFARETFSGDALHKIYYLEATRLEALAYACIDRHVAAKRLLDDLYDAAYGGDVTERHVQLAAESRYNLAMLYSKEAHGAGSHSAAALTAFSLFDQVAAGDDAVLAQAAGVWQAAQLARMTRLEWLLLPRDTATKRLEAATRAATRVAEAAQGAAASDHRRYALLARHARESAAIAELHYISAFELPCRGPFANGGRVPEPLLARVRASLESLSSTARFEPPPTLARTAAAYGLLLDKRWVDAEETALAAVTANPTDQFAMYIAAEAAVQRNDRITARKYLSELPKGAVTEPALSALSTDIEKQAA